MITVTDTDSQGNRKGIYMSEVGKGTKKGILWRVDKKEKMRLKPGQGERNRNNAGRARGENQGQWWKGREKQGQWWKGREKQG